MLLWVVSVDITIQPQLETTFITSTAFTTYKIQHSSDPTVPFDYFVPFFRLEALLTMTDLRKQAEESFEQNRKSSSQNAPLNQLEEFDEGWQVLEQADADEFA